MADYGVPDESITMLIGPALAELWIDELENLCRPADVAAVERMAYDMRMGFWAQAPEVAPPPNTLGLNLNSIKIDQHLRLIDGIRRLIAIAASGETIRIRVERVISLPELP